MKYFFLAKLSKAIFACSSSSSLLLTNCFILSLFLLWFYLFVPKPKSINLRIFCLGNYFAHPCFSCTPNNFSFFQNYPFLKTYRLQIHMKDSQELEIRNDESIRPLPSPPPPHQLHYTTFATPQHCHFLHGYRPPFGFA